MSRKQSEYIDFAVREVCRVNIHDTVRRAKCRASMPTVSGIRICMCIYIYILYTPISCAQTSNANDCLAALDAVAQSRVSRARARASVYHEICPENRAPLITPFCHVLHNRHNYPYIGDKLQPRGEDAASRHVATAN